MGFTLIELVAVIILLAILAVIAAPKFINLASDANKSILLTAKASIQSANSLVNAKSHIMGNDQLPYSVDGGPVINNAGTIIPLAYGFAVATEDAVSKIFDFDPQVFGIVQAAEPTHPYGGSVYIYIKSRTPTDGDPDDYGSVIDQIQEAECNLTYFSATSSDKPAYTVISNEGC